MITFVICYIIYRLLKVDLNSVKVEMIMVAKHKLNMITYHARTHFRLQDVLIHIYG